MTDEYLRTLEDLAKPFIEAGIYNSSEAFVRELVKDVAANRIETYQRTIKRYEAKYGSFERLGKKIKGRATPKQEDEWMEWEAARNMLKAWKSVARELGLSAS